MQKKKINETFLTKIIRWMLYIAPAILYFSYYPLIHFGANETMNFEISLPLLWLVIFDVFGLVLMIKERKLMKILMKWQWLLLPVFMTISIFWSQNLVRGFLTVAIVWLIYFAIFVIVNSKELLSGEKHKKIFWRWFFGSSLVFAGWCWIQSLLDVFGVPAENTLLCGGCVYKMFGFPRPNGFAIEPQFMGNLLLAPTLVAGYFALTKAKVVKHPFVIFFVLAMTLFLTFSRGAIYAFVLALSFMAILMAVWERTARGLYVLAVAVVAFLATLCAQGIFAEISPTNDTFVSGVSKVVEQLSLGVVDVPEPEVNDEGADENEANEEIVIDENTAVFDGYVAESTDTRLSLTNSAIRAWRKDWHTVLFGVGLGGAGNALYNNGLVSSPKEIVQNQYASLLLEIGLVGVALVVFTIVMVFRQLIKTEGWVPLLTLVLAYGVTLVFFAGLPNALHIYLLPALLMVFF